MRIDFESEGGYANIGLKYHVDSAKLPSDVAEKLHDLVKGVLAMEQKEGCEASARSSPVAIQYRLTITDGDLKISLSVDDVSAPPELRPLLSYLRTLAFEERRAASGSR